MFITAMCRVAFTVLVKNYVRNQGSFVKSAMNLLATDKPFCALKPISFIAMIVDVTLTNNFLALVNINELHNAYITPSFNGIPKVCLSKISLAISKWEKQ